MLGNPNIGIFTQPRPKADIGFGVQAIITLIGNFVL
jgi:hypothetical protein